MPDPTYFYPAIHKSQRICCYHVSSEGRKEENSEEAGNGTDKSEEMGTKLTTFNTFTPAFVFKSETIGKETNCSVSVCQTVLWLFMCLHYRIQYWNCGSSGLEACAGLFVAIKQLSKQIHALIDSFTSTFPGLLLCWRQLHSPLECCQPGINVLLFAVNTLNTCQNLGQVFLPNLIVL